MFRKNSIYWVIFLAVETLLFGYLAINRFYAFGNNFADKGMKLITGIVFAGVAIFFAFKLIQFIKKQQALKQGE